MNWVCSLSKCGQGDMTIFLEINERLSYRREAIYCLGIAKGKIRDEAIEDTLAHLKIE